MPQNYEKKEREAGAVVECLAKESCAKAIEEEKVQTIKRKAEEADRDKKKPTKPSQATVELSSSTSPSTKPTCPAATLVAKLAAIFAYVPLITTSPACLRF